MSDPVSIDLVWLAHGKGLPLPRQQTPGAAGLDLAAALAPDEVVEVEAPKGKAKTGASGKQTPAAAASRKTGTGVPSQTRPGAQAETPGGNKSVEGDPNQGTEAR